MNKDGINFWPMSVAARTPGAARVNWWRGTPGSVLSGTTAAELSNWWDAVRPGSQRPTVTNLGGTVLTFARAWGAGPGNYILYANGNAGFAGHGFADSRIMLGQRFDIAAPVAPPTAQAVTVLRLDMAVLAGVVMTTFLGGFCCGVPASMWGNMTTDRILTGNSFRCIGLVRDGTGTYLAIRSSDALETLRPITADITQRSIIEHRLIAPTVSGIGRYELRINDELIETVDGDDPHWPQPTAAGMNLIPVPFARDAGASDPTGTTGAQHWHSDVYSGPDIPDTTDD